MTSFCPGYKDAALTYAVEQLAEKEGISFKKMIRRIENRTIPQLTKEKIKALDYAYCEITLENGDKHAFLVPAIRGHTAQAQARLYLRRESIDTRVCPAVRPRNKFLVNKALKLFDEKRYLKPENSDQ